MGERRQKVSDDPISTVIIGRAREVTDIYYDWARIREGEGPDASPQPVIDQRMS